MAFGVPSTLYAPGPMEALNMKSKNGVPMIIPGLQWLQYGLVNYNTSNAEASLLSGTAKGSLLIPGGTLAYAPDLGNANTPGTILRFRLAGTLKNTGTPNLTVRTTFTNAAGTVATLATSGAVAMVTTTTVVLEFEIETWHIVTAYSATVGAVNSGGRVIYHSAAGQVQSIAITPTVLGSLDLTSAFTFDCKATFSASSADNAIIVYNATLEVLS